MSLKCCSRQDYEAHQPGGLNDSVAYATMVGKIAAQSSTGSILTVDFPCDGQTCDTPTLVDNKGVGKVLSMNTYVSAAAS
eukprot:COSAG02_NODE_2367_length_9051_cov_10.810433_7_plen_80_part_00